MMNVKFPVSAIIGGAAITLLTGLINTTPSILGAVWYGFPLAWLIRLVIAPEYYPWRVNFLNFGIDIIIWAVVVGIVIFIFKKIKK